jgi:hypothetical protein
MQRLFALLAALVTAALLPAAAVDSIISAVTVYTDRAAVTRTAAVDLPTGTTVLVFTNLPQALQERSLQVSARQAFVDFSTNPRVQEL